MPDPIFTLKKDDLVKWTPNLPDWTYPTKKHFDVPPTGTLGTVLTDSHSHLHNIWFPGGTVRVKWEGEDSDTYPVSCCTLIKQPSENRERKPIILETNAGRDTCFKCNKPTKLLDWGIPAADSQYCPFCKI